MNDLLKRWVDQNTTEFEFAVLWLATHDLEAWISICKVVCRDSRGEAVRDFLSPLNGAYYEVVYTARMAMASPEPAVGRVLFSAMLMSMAVRGEHVGRSEAGRILELYDLLAGQDYRQMKMMLREALPYWINKQRASVMMGSAVGSANWDADSLLRSLTTELAHTSSQLETDEHVAEVVYQILNQKMPDSSGCMPTGLVRLDIMLGGGFYIGDGNLVIAAPGVGKTVFACQLALYVALMNRLVVFITTEQPVSQLTARWVSNWCNYAFNHVSRGYDIRLLPKEVRAKCMKLAHIIQKRIYVFDWKQKKKSVLAGGIEEEISIAENKAGMPCSLVIMDWLGGGLTDDVKDDKDKKRLALQNTADRMTEIACNRKICSVAMAQAHKAKGVNNMFVGVAEVPENHTLDQSMTTVTGITGMLSTEARDRIKTGQSPDGYDLFAEDQYFFVSKARMSRGGHAGTRRRFRYQRYEDRD